MLNRQFKQAIKSIRGLKKSASEEKFLAVLEDYDMTSEAMKDFLNTLFVSADKSLESGLDEKSYSILIDQARLITQNYQSIQDKILEMDNKIHHPEELPDDYEACADCGFDHSYPYLCKKTICFS